jgi:cell pole-organizing protein PopZ
MAKASASAEPSMEEILASIRRIISDDGSPAAKPAAVEAAPVAMDVVGEDSGGETHVTEDDLDRLFASGGDDADDDGEVLDLAEASIEVDEPLDLVEGFGPDEADIAFSEPVLAEPELVPEDDMLGWEDPVPEPEPVAEPEPAPRATRPVEPPPPPPPTSDERLVSPETGASVNAAFGQLTHTILAANARTLDDLVKEMLKPMLKAWLDENLPSVVERLVRAEIERVSRGR